MAEPAIALPLPMVPPVHKQLREHGAHRLRRAPALVLGCGLLLSAMLLGALLAPIVAPRDPFTQELASRLVPPAWMTGSQPGFYLGTDELGRDILSRILYGGRISLSVS